MRGTTHMWSSMRKACVILSYTWFVWYGRKGNEGKENKKKIEIFLKERKKRKKEELKGCVLDLGKREIVLSVEIKLGWEIIVKWLVMEKLKDQSLKRMNPY